MKFQINRRGLETWEITRYTRVSDDEHEYELAGRVICEPDGRYYVDFPLWQSIGFAWERQSQSYTVRKKAIQAVTERVKRWS